MFPESAKGACLFGTPSLMDRIMMDSAGLDNKKPAILGRKRVYERRWTPLG